MYCCVLTYIGPNHLYLLVVCIKTPFKFSDDQKVFVYYKHNTNQYWPMELIYVWLDLLVLACMHMYCFVLLCIEMNWSLWFVFIGSVFIIVFIGDPYGLYYYTCIYIPVHDSLNEYIPILSFGMYLHRLVCMCVYHAVCLLPSVHQSI